MNQYFLKQTSSTPSVIFDQKNGDLSINGVSTPEDALGFYSNVYNLVEQVDNVKTDVVRVNIGLKKITNSTSYLYILIKKLISFSDTNRKVVINWYYENENEDIRLAGEDISSHYNYPFKFKKLLTNKNELLRAS